MIYLSHGLNKLLRDRTTPPPFNYLQISLSEQRADQGSTSFSKRKYSEVYNYVPKYNNCVI